MSTIDVFRGAIELGFVCLEVRDEDQAVAEQLLKDKAESCGLMHPGSMCNMYHSKALNIELGREESLSGIVISYPEEIRQDVLDNLKRIEESNAS